MIPLCSCFLRYEGEYTGTARNTANSSRLGWKYKLKSTTKISMAPSHANKWTSNSGHVWLQKEKVIHTTRGQK